MSPPTSILVGWRNLHPTDVPQVGMEEQGCVSLGQVYGFSFAKPGLKSQTSSVGAVLVSGAGTGVGGFWQHPRLGWILSSLKV